MFLVDDNLLDELVAKAVDSPRKRSHHNLHESLEDDFHRLLIAAVSGTYMRPHRHTDPPKWELMMMLRGEMMVLVFDDYGDMIDRIGMSADGPIRCYEIPPGVWHAFAVPSADMVAMEVKPGPYLPLSDTDIAQWAPPEGDPKAPATLEWYLDPNPGRHT